MSPEPKQAFGSGDPGSTRLGLFGWLETTAELAEATSDEAWVRAMLEFESALAEAEGEIGLIPRERAQEIAAGCAAAELDPEILGRAARLSGNPVVPLLRALRQRLSPGAANQLHRGATSQDVLDTAQMLLAKSSGELISAELGAAAAAAADLARRHRQTLEPGRTLLQQALPTTFGLRAATWLVAIWEARDALDRVLRERLALQLGGAAGTLASLGTRGPEVAEIMARRLGLELPTLPWHTDRTRVAELGAALAESCGVAAKVARDVVLLSQSELGEALEGGGADHGGSSTMPQKRNPAGAVAIIAGYRRAVPLAAGLLGGMAQELDRSAGDWQAEWSSLTQLLRLAGGCASGLRSLLRGLEIDPVRMTANLGLTQGALLAERLALELAGQLGRERANELVAAAARRAAAGGGSLRQEVEADPQLGGRFGPQQLDQLFDPSGYLGAASEFIDRALRLEGEKA